MEKNYYKILGISPQSNEREIKKAFRDLAKRYHPDKQSEFADEKKFNEVLRANKVLSNKKQREKYDSLYMMENISDINKVSYSKPENKRNNYRASPHGRVKVSEGYGKINSFIIISLYVILIVITYFLLRWN